VDADGIISQNHLGKQVNHSKDKAQLDIWQINESYKNEAKYIALTDPQSVLINSRYITLFLLIMILPDCFTSTSMINKNFNLR
jgi:hypothetical protein